MMSFVANFLISLSRHQNYFDHELGYYVGSFLASSTIGIIIAIVAITMWKRTHHIPN
ncbi:MAG: hypothetical protein ACREBB_07640 [Nitrosotalea sp.]